MSKLACGNTGRHRAGRRTGQRPPRAAAASRDLADTGWACGRWAG